MPKKSSPTKFKLRTGDNIGAMSAEFDQKFLTNCFIKTDQYESILDLSNPKFILLGRTGSGKTAILQRIEETQENVIKIDPKDLCLENLGNSDVMKLIDSLGVKIDPFFEMMWRYTFIIELLLKKYSFNRNNIDFNLFEKIVNPQKARAVKLLKDLSPEFWDSIDRRIAYINRIAEEGVQQELGGNLQNLVAKIKQNSGIKKEEKEEYKSKIEKVLNNDKIKALKDAVKFLAEDVFNDKRKSYYIIIDDLDHDFISTHINYKIIKSLIDCVKSMRAISTVKIMVGMRNDLFEGLLRDYDGHIQREKYTDLALEIRWSSHSLIELVNKRLNFLYKNRYTSESVSFYNIFCEEVKRTKTREYILDRTMMRPRDVIDFVNLCISEANDQNQITARSISEAEKRYSDERFKAICDEWANVYNIISYTAPFFDKDTKDKLGTHFILKNITIDVIEKFSYKLIGESADSNSEIVNNIYETKSVPTPDLISIWIETLYKVGIIGIKNSPTIPEKWSFKDSTYIPAKELNGDVKISVHKMFWAKFGIYST